MVREVGRRTRLKNRDVQAMLEALIVVWTAELVEGSGRIELEHFMVLEVRDIDRGENAGILENARPPRHIRRIHLRVAKHLKRQLG
ncbi:MAG: hypothetical protein SF123_00465 [Chloroflexota bacterium]|nr:hypothetical protein [Chloroflexota bacterium]